jgi:hypothetical protein
MLKLKHLDSREGRRDDPLVFLRAGHLALQAAGATRGVENKLAQGR